MGHKKVIIAAGGTGGHLFPAQQLYSELEDCEVLFAGHKLASSPFFNSQKVPFQEIPSAPLKSLKFLKEATKGFWQSLKLLREFRPDIVVGFGSFHTFPILLAAAALRIKIILFEPNCSLGLVNRFFSPVASKIAFQFPVSMKKSVLVPLLPWGKKDVHAWERSDARRAYGLETDLLTLLIFGGSQGAVFINRLFCKAVPLLKAKGIPFQVIHLTGNNSGNETEIYEKLAIPHVVKSFETNMLKAYAAADLAVCRCGAGTTAELIRFQLPSVLIPYPYAYNHQQKNGKFLGKGARILLQNEATAEKLASAVEHLIEDRALCIESLKELEFGKTVEMSNLVRGEV
jgi:UDP-N-acetylglucosamine--N-acetylmuramyl-(pentapeptide) pyrophosphoryl-undecaprenol N-acetylglucosamine transferase